MADLELFPDTVARVSQSSVDAGRVTTVRAHERAVRPRARLSDPQMAHEAARLAAPTAGTLRARCLEVLRAEGPLCDFRLGELVGARQTSAGKRRLELQRLGLVEQTAMVCRVHSTGSHVWQAVPMTEQKILNLRERWDRSANYKRVDRTTEFGNPFVMLAGGNRDEVCDKFHEWFHAPEQAALRERAIRELSGFDLACWCAPLRCHAETIRDWIGRTIRASDD